MTPKLNPVALAISAICLLIVASCGGDFDATGDTTQATKGKCIEGSRCDEGLEDDFFDPTDPDNLADPTDNPDDPPNNDDPPNDDPPNDDPPNDDGPNLQACLEEAASHQFVRSRNPKLPGLGDCVTVMSGAALFNYHCIHCHGSLNNNDIVNRSRTRIVDFGIRVSENLNNWPQGGISDYPIAVDRIVQAIQNSPEAQ